MKKELSGVLAIDAGVLIELVYSTAGGLIVRNALLDEILDAHTTEIAITELNYILCRKIGMVKAKENVKKLLASGYIVVEKTLELIEIAAEYKCKRSIALPDCFSLALAKNLSSPALFAEREEELVKEIQKESFDVKILFLSDYEE